MAASKVAATNAAIINAVRINASEQYRARIPEITDSNLTKNACAVARKFSVVE